MGVLHSLLAAGSHHALTQRMRDCASQLGFDKFSYSVHARRGGLKRLYEVSGYPQAWVSRYDERRYEQLDPLIRSCLESTLPIIWNDALFAGESHVLREETKRYGLVHGLSCPVHDGSGTMGMLCLARQAPALDTNDATLVDLLGTSQLLASYAHVAVQKLLACHGQPKPVIELTQREKEVLQWAGQGKTAWEISRILGISERTAVFHLSNARHKIGAINCTQAVAMAMLLGLIR